MDGSC
jgi:hypothetical protein